MGDFSAAKSEDDIFDIGRSVEMAVNKRSETIGVGVAGDVKSAAAAAAAADNRSIASFVETLLIDHLISQGYLDADRNGRNRRASLVPLIVQNQP